MLNWIRGFFICSLFAIILGTIHLISNFSLSDNKDELNVFVYNNFLDLEMVNAFTEETGIKVRLHYFNSNEELIAKLEITNAEGYDILFPTDYACKILEDKGFLQPLDKSKLDFFEKIYPFLLNKNFDPENRYSIPYMWEVYGIAYDPTLISKEKFFIKDYYNPSYRKVMPPDFIESINIASLHLFGDKNFLTDQEKKDVSNLLKIQNDSIVAYADFRAKDIITSKNAEVVLLKTSYLDEMKKEKPQLEYTLPKDKFFTSIENTAICKTAKNIDNAYAFLNYIYKAENLALAVNLFRCYPACPETFNCPHDHHEKFLEVIEEVKSRPQDMRLFYYITDPDTARDMFIKSKF